MWDLGLDPGIEKKMNGENGKIKIKSVVACSLVFVPKIISLL